MQLKWPVITQLKRQSWSVKVTMYLNRRSWPVTMQLNTQKDQKQYDPGGIEISQFNFICKTSSVNCWKNMFYKDILYPLFSKEILFL